MSAASIIRRGGAGARRITPGSMRLLFDGNSFLDPAYPQYNIGAVVRASTIGASFASYANIGISGQTLEDMRTNVSDLTTNLSAATCVLVIMETTNSVFNIGDTKAQTLTALNAYTSFVKSSSPAAVIVYCGTVPRKATPAAGGATMMQGNQTLVDVDTDVDANRALYNIDACVYFRQPSGPFGFSDWTNTASYDAGGGYADYIHPSNPVGRQYLGDRIAEVLSGLT